MSEITGQFVCPVEVVSGERISLSHGAGGKQTAQLIEDVFVPAFDNAQLEDAATFELPPGRVAFTTDSFVIKPLFFPGGDIGSLAVTGTVNDLAMKGARPLYLSVGLIIEEGLLVEDLKIIVQSMAVTARAAGVSLVTGDTKVVEKGKGDQLFINTAGVGVIEQTPEPSVALIQPGDAIILSGDIGRHGVAVMAQRNGLGFETDIVSDAALLSPVVGALLDKNLDIRCMRDLTRGGLVTALVEIAQSRGLAFELQESEIPVNIQVNAACEILGIDPHYVANEGRFVVFVPESQAEAALKLLKTFEGAQLATQIGKVANNSSARVVLTTEFGTQRVLDRLSGEQLPRIC
jgi:hydrogenase expression/formation protein HypE